MELVVIQDEVHSKGLVEAVAQGKDSQLVSQPCITLRKCIGYMQWRCWYQVTIQSALLTFKHRPWLLSQSFHNHP